MGYALNLVAPLTGGCVLRTTRTISEMSTATVTTITTMRTILMAWLSAPLLADKVTLRGRNQTGWREGVCDPPERVNKYLDGFGWTLLAWQRLMMILCFISRNGTSEAFSSMSVWFSGVCVIMPSRPCCREHSYMIIVHHSKVKATILP